MTAFIRTIAHSLERKTFSRLSFFGPTAGVVLLAMMIVTVADAIGRPFGHSIFGTYETVEFLLTLLFPLAICYCAIKKAHFSLRIVTLHLQPKVRLHIAATMHFLSTLVCWILSWQLVVYALIQKTQGTTGMAFTFLPIHPFIFVAALLWVIIGWLFLMQGVHFLEESTNEGG